MNSSSFLVRCWHCLSEYDAYASSWCRHAEPTKICPFCFQCFCNATEEYKRNFWETCPDDLLSEKYFATESVHTRLGDVLLKAGKISEEQLKTALRQQQIFRKKLGETLIMMSLLTPEELELYLLNQDDLEKIDLASVEIDSSLIRSIGIDLCISLEIIPLEIENIGSNRVFRFAFHSMEDLQKVKAHPKFQEYSLIPNLAEKEALLRYLDSIRAENMEKNKTEQVGGNSPQMKIINEIIKTAIIKEYSDIYFAKSEDLVQVFYQDDDQVIKTDLPETNHSLFFSLLKKACGIDEEHREEYQKTFLKLHSQLEQYQIRAFYLPSPNQENLRLKIINNQKLQHPLEEYGWDRDEIETISKSLKEEQGLYIIAGQNRLHLQEIGYSLMNRLKPQKSATIESMILKRDASFFQIEKDEQEIGPDIFQRLTQLGPESIFLFDLFDKHYTPLFFQYAEKGKLFLIIRAFSYEELFEKLFGEQELSYDPFIKNLRMILFHRQTHRLCPHCKVPDPKTLRDYFSESHFSKDFPLLKENGCPQCAQSGVLGRGNIAEIFSINDKERRHFQPEDLSAIPRKISESGRLPISRKAMNKLLKGEISFREYLKFI